MYILKKTRIYKKYTQGLGSNVLGHLKRGALLYWLKSPMQKRKLQDIINI